MKLSAGVLAALASVGGKCFFSSEIRSQSKNWLTCLDAAITCPPTGGVARKLFEVDCSATDGFKIRINEGCRKTTFTMVDFANSFVWKAATPTKMNTFTGSNWEAVNGDSADVCKTVVPAGSTATATDISPKPLASGQEDAEGQNAFGWNIPFSCATATENAADANSNNAKFLTYDLYWNSQFSDGGDGANPPNNENFMYQLGQVKISCRINPYQEDAGGVVTITEDAAVADIADKYVDVADGLELKVKKVSFDSLDWKFTFTEVEFDATNPNPVDEDGLSAATIATGATGLSYVDAGGSAKIGDYMELSLENTPGTTGAGVSTPASTVLDDFAWVYHSYQQSLKICFSVSITKCWASISAKPATDLATDQKYYADTNTAAATDVSNLFIMWGLLVLRNLFSSTTSAQNTQIGLVQTHPMLRTLPNRPVTWKRHGTRQHLCTRFTSGLSTFASLLESKTYIKVNFQTIRLPVITSWLCPRCFKPNY